MRLVVAAMLAAVAGTAGCGGTEVDPGTSALTAGAGSFAESANRICLQVAQRFEEAQRETPRSFEQGEQVTDALVGISAEGERALQALSPSPLQAAAYERYLRSRAKAAALLTRARTAAREEEGQAYDDARVELAAGSEGRRRLAKQAGLSRCAGAEQG